ncbi:MAG: response regulator [Treponema sp.]|jgi:signal transduction histidine kinase/DNA-binding response OmpR family regulator/HPt (histidine-containing phosphotransfer) domain-containing protein|nr:response regulator [Treponema sp.]
MKTSREEACFSPDYLEDVSLYSRLFRTSVVAMAVLDMEGRIFVSNRRFEELCRSFHVIPPVKNIEKRCFSIEELLDLEGGFRFDNFFARIISGSADSISYHLPLRLKGSLKPARVQDESEASHWLKIYAWIIKKNEELEESGPFIGLIIEDHTGKRQQELRLLEDKEIAEKAMEAKSQFLANTSHEIRTPIQTIMGMIELLQDTRLDHEQAEYCRQVKFSADVLLSLINDILDYSKIEAGKMELEHIDFDLAETVEQAVEMISLEAHKKGLEIVVDIPLDANIVIVGDPNKFRQIVINLVKNAVKFTQQGGVVIRAGLVYLSGEGASGGNADPQPDMQLPSAVNSGGAALQREAIRVSVADTGIGISEEKRAQLFTTFMQADASNSRRFGGTGLGLAISRNLVELMGGVIEMEPNKEGGSIFRFTVPLERSSTGRSTRPLKTIRGDKIRTLIVDDSPEARYILASYARDIGLSDIVTAASGETALTMMRGAVSRKNPYELCFIDMIMPVMDGWRLASKIHNDPLISNTKLILMVPHGLLSADTKMTLLKWFLAYINKPIKRRELVETVYTVLSEPQIVESIPSDESTNTEILQGAGDKPLILMAEDHPVNQQLFSLILDKLGYPVVLASDGLDALEKVEQNPVSLIFMDIQMPLMNGYEAAEVLRRQGYKQPIIAVTASTAEERAQCLKAGFNDILIKPFKRSDLEQMLVKWEKVTDAAPSINEPQGISSSLLKEDKSMAEKYQAPRVKKGLLARSISLINTKEKAMSASALAPGKVKTGLLAKMNAIKEQNDSLKVESEEVFNPVELLDTFMDNAEMVKSLLGRFLGRTRGQVESMQKLVANGDWEELRREAHTIKASSLTLSGKELGASAFKLELAAKNKDMPNIETAYPLFRDAFARFEQAASRFLEK